MQTPGHQQYKAAVTIYTLLLEQATGQTPVGLSFLARMRPGQWLQCRQSKKVPSSTPARGNLSNRSCCACFPSATRRWRARGVPRGASRPNVAVWGSQTRKRRLRAVRWPSRVGSEDLAGAMATGARCLPSRTAPASLSLVLCETLALGRGGCCSVIPRRPQYCSSSYSLFNVFLVPHFPGKTTEAQAPGCVARVRSQPWLDTSTGSPVPALTLGQEASRPPPHGGLSFP